MFRLIYHSVPFGYDAADLAGILVTARRRNVEDDITGVLICRADLYLQWLEGPQAAVTACYARIARDDRHVDVTRRIAGPVTGRRFGAWAMRHDPADTWMWDAPATRAGAPETSSDAEILAVFDRLEHAIGIGS